MRQGQEREEIALVDFPDKAYQICKPRTYRGSASTSIHSDIVLFGPRCRLTVFAAEACRLETS